MNGIDDYLDSIEAQQRQQAALDRSMAAAATVAPDIAARQQWLAKQTGVPSAVVPLVKDQLEQSVRDNALRAQDLPANAPRTADWLAKPDNMAVAHDDVQSLSLIERLINSAKRGWKGLQETVPATALRSNASSLTNIDTVLARVAIGERPEFIPDSQDTFGVRWMKPEQVSALRASLSGAVAGQASSIATLEADKRAIPQDPVVAATMAAKGFKEAFSLFAQKPLEFIATVGIESGVQNLPTLVAGAGAALAGSPGAAASVFGAGSFATDYGASILEALQTAGVDVTNKEALIAATQNKDLMSRVGRAASTHASIVAAMDAVSGGLAGKSLASRQWVNLALQAPAQGAIGAAGEAVGSAAAGKDVAAGELLAEFFGEFAGSPAEVASMSARRIASRIGAARQAEASAAAIEQLNTLAKASKLRERAPDTFGDFVAAAAADGPVTDVYINAQVLQQSGLAEQLMQASPAAAEQMATALATGTDIRIPVDEYAGRVAGQEFAQPLLDHLRTEADGMSRAEAKEFMQTQGEELQRTVEKALAEHQSDQAFKAEAEKVRTEVERQLNEVGRFTPDVNASYATLMGSFYAAQAARLGITPTEMLARFPVRIAGQGVGEFTQITPEQAMRTRTAMRMPDHAEFSAAVANTNGAEITPDGLLISLQRHQKPEQSGDYSVRTGVFYLPVGDPNAKHYKKGVSGHGGTETHSGETLLRAPIFVKGATGGKAPEAAYENIAGKGAMKKLDDEIMGVITSRGWMNRQDPGLHLELVERLLSDHGADPTMAYDILEKSQQGNQLRYALQENIIAHAVRAAGYDSVVGYSKGKAGSRISEVFDVRELTYPAKGVESEIHGAFNQAARATFNPSTSTIALLKGADLSSFLHESGHFYLETLFAMAEQVRNQQAPAEGGIDIVKDADALLKWFGVSDLATWYTMSLDEQRPYHEQFARGFERYLFEGNSPSIEMQSLFQRFAAWMLNVYRNLKALNVELNSEVRSVMDRMLASREQIRETEMAGSMMPLFDSAEAAGMDPVAWRAYQALANDATQTAMGELETRSLRDMQWLANARSRAIKELQKQAAERRRSVRMEARAEVMAKPVYRAWQFLTGKIEAGDRLGGNKRASDPNVVDETQDSLFVAIAKLGGLDRGQVESQWGFDPKQKAPQPVFGKPLLRHDGGLTLDAMAEKLAELGYIQRDENGKHDLTELEDKFDEESRGRPQHSFAADYGAMAEGRAGEQYNIGGLRAGRLDRGTLRLMDLPGTAVERLTKLRMVAKEGIDPDILATLFGFSSGDEMVQALAAANTPSSEVEGRTDQLMLERYGDLVDEKAIERAANKAVHNLNRSRVIETELSALDKANRVRSPNGKTDKNGRPRSFAVLPKAAKQFAANMIAKLQVRNLKPAHYTAAEVRAAKAAEKALRSGDLTVAASEKRNQLIQHYAARAALDAVSEMEKGVAYLKRIETSKTIDADYLDQIHQLLEKFDLRPASLKAIDGRKSLADWIESQRDMGLEPQIPQDVLDAAGRTHFKDLTVEQIRGLVDTVRQIEHLGRLKHRLLTARDQRDLERAVDELVTSIEDNGPDKMVDLRTRTTWPATVKSMGRQFLAIHRKMASYARQMDGAKDGGAVWEYFIRTMNDHADMEAQMRADATARLNELITPLFEGERMHRARFFPAVQMSLTREERLGIALNTGNAGNKQRLLDGEGWRQEQLDSILATLTAADWTAVQNIWDYFESYRPQIAAKERRVYGKEPDWVEPVPFDVEVDGKTMSMRGGYYPVKYDPARNAKAGQHAEAEEARQMLKGAYTSATTRRSFTKARAEEVVGRPLLYGLQGLYQGTTEVIHDLSWHEWLIDVNRLLRSKAVDGAIRHRYGAEVVDQFNKAIKDIAAGDAPAQHVGERILNHIRTGATVAGLGWNLTTSLLQPLGLTQSMVRIGPAWVARGMGEWFKSPLSTSERINEMSTFMALRAQTQQREINEIRNKVSGQSDVRQAIEQSFFMMIAKMQQVADIPTWLGQYEKSIAAGETEPRAIALADQAVRDSQGGGQIGDLSQIQRGGPAFKLFTNFYSFFNVAYNQGAESWNRTDFKKPGDVMRLATDFLLLYSVPAALATLLKSALVGDADDPEKLMRKLIAEQISYLFGLMVGVRELSAGVATMLGVQQFDATYSGPAGLRLFSEATKLAKQIQQGEWDTAMRKALVNTSGILFHLPSGQVNRTWDGVQALSDGTTQNPLAPLVGAPPKN